LRTVKAVLIALPTAGVLVVGLWANFHLIGWTRLAVRVALMGLLGFHGARVNDRIRQQARGAEMKNGGGGKGEPTKMHQPEAMGTQPGDKIKESGTTTGRWSSG
jgi:hypothetical protein